MTLEFDGEGTIPPKSLLSFLRKLELKLASSQVRALFLDAPPRVQNEYALLQRDVTLLRSRLTITKLKQVAGQLEAHSKELRKRAKLLKQEIDELRSARRVLTKLDKFVSMVSRIAIFLL